MPLSFHSYLVFIASGALLCIVPGPDMAYMLGRTVTQAKRAGLVAAVGINAGGYAHIAAAVLGLSAILATSAVAFTVVKILGAAYLIWIGFRTLRLASSAGSRAKNSIERASLRRIFWEGFLSDALNPKVSIFFLAFLPRFVDRAAATSVPVSAAAPRSDVQCRSHLHQLDASRCGGFRAEACDGEALTMSSAAIGSRMREDDGSEELSGDD